MTPAEILRSAKEKISDPGRWCRGDYARDANDHRTFPSDPNACQWCAVGALRAVGGFDNDYEALDAVPSLSLNPGTLIEANDTGTHADVMAMFDKAIALAEKS